nr:response regulator [Parvularcula dongshanensis]
MIFLAVTGAHFVSVHAVALKEDYARVINFSGRQRMLSQRILYLASAPQEPGKSGAKLADTIDLFERSHRALRGRGDYSEALPAKHDQPYRADDLDERVRLFIGAARRVVSAAQGERDRAVDELTRVGDDRFLEDLDDAVARYEAEAAQVVERVQTISKLTYAVTLLLLLAEAVFIFLPTYRLVATAFAREKSKSDRLAASERAARHALKSAQIARETAERAQERAEEATLAKSRFLATISHEVRTPLDGMIGMLDLLREHEADPERRRQLHAAFGSAEALLRLLDEVLDYARLAAGKVELDETPFSPGALVAEVAPLFGVAASRKGLTIGSQATADLPERVCGDADRVRQVLFNLVANVVECAEAGHIGVSATVLSEPRGDGTPLYRLSVTNSGIGTAESDIERVFARFEQADGSTIGGDGGTGLGLAICEKLVTLMGGTMSVVSERGRETTFHVDLPLLLGEGADRYGSASAGQTEDRSSRPLRVLAAEDHPVNQQVLRAVLEGAGHAVTIVGDGAAALTAVQKEEFDIVLMDLSMPTMDGIAAVRAIRDLPTPARDLPVLAITAHASPEHERLCLDAGMSGYLTKPLRPALLHAEMARLTSADEFELCWREAG